MEIEPLQLLNRYKEVEYDEPAKIIDRINKISIDRENILSNLKSSI